MQLFATYELNDRNNFTSADAYTKYNVDGDLAYSKASSTTYKLYMEGQINYARKFGKHDVTGMVLYNQNDYRYNSDLAKRYQGLVGRVTYGYDDKYLAEVNVGYNGSENFLKGKRFGFFPCILTRLACNSGRVYEANRKLVEQLEDPCILR